jgi:Ala-tRNA(Pro) deacylase
MDQTLKSYLKEHNIQYKIHTHQPVFTVEESKKIDKQMPRVFHTKNLFLKDEGKKFFLVSMSANKRLDLKKLKEKLNAKKKLSFGTAEQLKEHLNLSPGSVSIFGMIYSKDVTLILDKQIWQAPIVGFHPNINTATLELSHENLEKFYNSIKTEKIIMDLD